MPYLGEHNLLIEQHQQACWSLLDQVQDRLVVDELNVRKVDLLLLVALLLELERVVVKVLLQLLVGKVDAQLLEAVLLKDLEAKDIQHTNVTVVATCVGC